MTHACTHGATHRVHCDTHTHTYTHKHTHTQHRVHCDTHTHTRRRTVFTPLPGQSRAEQGQTFATACRTLQESVLASCQSRDDLVGGDNTVNILPPKPFSPKLVSQGEEEVKKNFYLVKQHVGFEPGTFGSTVKCFINYLVTCQIRRSTKISHKNRR